MAELAGKPLAKGHHRAIIWAIQGDQEFFSNVLKLSHWQNKYPCHECDAQKPMFKKKACPEGKSVKILKEENQQYEYVSPQQAVLAKRSSHPLFSIPCVSTAMVRGDSLHILYSRGWGPIWQEAFCTICAFMTGLKGKEPALPPGSRRSLPGSKSFTVKEKPLPDSQI